MNLNLACGEEQLEFARGVNGLWYEPWYGVDLRPTGSCHVIADLFGTFPFRTSSIDNIHCSHFVEHVPNLVQFMNEVWRVLKPGGAAHISCPYQFSVRAWQDPTHVRALNEWSWAYYQREWREANGLEHMGIVADFDVSVDFVLNPAARSYTRLGRPMPPENWRHMVNVIDDMAVDLVARK